LACKPKVELPQPVSASFKIVTPENYITAGNAISVMIINEEKYKGPAMLFVRSAYNNYSIPIFIKEEYQNVDLSGKYTQDSGLNEYVLIVGGEIKSKSTLEIRASDVVDPISVFTGPNTIWVNDLQESMIVSLPKDAYGNPGRKGDSINFNMRLPDETAIQNELKINNQLTYTKVNSRDKRGKIFVGVESDLARAKEQRVDVIEVWPEEIRIVAEEILPYADSRQFYRLNTELLSDRNGDRLVDGTLITYIAKCGGKQVRYNSYTIDGKAKVYIRNPSKQCNCVIHSEMGDGVVKSNSIELEFKSSVKDIPYEIESDIIVVGPITSYIDQYIADGTKVYFYSNGKKKMQETEDGYVRFELTNELIETTVVVSDKTVRIN
jgi:hypothetical protein